MNNLHLSFENFKNPELSAIVKNDNDLKKYLVEYVGKKLNKKDITVEMIVDILSKEFPEFLLVIAEENFIRGYEQAMIDVDQEPLEIKGKKLNKRKK